MVLIIGALSFAISGYRQGFIVGVLSLIGFVGGGAFGMWLAPKALHRMDQGLLASVLAICLVLAMATVGQMLATMLGGRMREHVTWQSARVVDAGAGAALSTVAMLVFTWFLAAAVAGSSIPWLAKQVRGSQVLHTITKAMPGSAESWFSEFGNLLNHSGLPQAFGPFTPERIADVPPPDPKVLASAAVRNSQDSIVKVLGTARSCGKEIEGSGFVFAPQHVMTNAHVVGGVRSPTVYVRGLGAGYDARVVLFDPSRDVAVLYVPGLRAAPLRFDRAAKAGSNAVVAGFPENQAFTPVAARIRDEIAARGQDIYNQTTVTRDVFSLYATVRQGNSGGPLLAPSGQVYGVVFAKSLDDATTGYALTAREVATDAATGADATDTVDTQSCVM